jgi:hypothetical protein
MDKHVKKDYHHIRYVSGFNEDLNGIKTPRYQSKRVSKKYVKTYTNCQHKLARVNRCAERLVYFLAQEMDNTNTIHHNKVVRTKFIKQASKNYGLSFKDDTVKKAFYELVKVDLVMRYGKSDYCVNPLHLYKGSEEERKKLISSLINIARKSTNPHCTLRRGLNF